MVTVAFQVPFGTPQGSIVTLPFQTPSLAVPDLRVRKALAGKPFGPVNVTCTKLTPDFASLACTDTATVALRLRTSTALGDRDKEVSVGLAVSLALVTLKVRLNPAAPSAAKSSPVKLPALSETKTLLTCQVEFRAHSGTVIVPR